ncbi:zinc-binding dehydrogenase [Paenibacillus foliorum]|uniref:zinc-binding dehydrogenase n=1 Tax=Paenibacillus foliorum TaxID=2654974 RepID=UPI0028B0F432|nr:zinc-binding dehydrogenase [Paenibacillus foliorum]
MEAADSVSKLEDGLGADIVYECAGKSNAVGMAFSIARRGGKVVLLGAACKDAKKVDKALDVLDSGKGIGKTLIELT